MASSWKTELAEHYDSRAGNVFLLHGNVGDLFIYDVPSTGAIEPGKRQLRARPPEGTPRITRTGDITACLQEEMLTNFNCIVQYDLGFGFRILKGHDIFRLWQPKTPLNMREPLPAMEGMSQFFNFAANRNKDAKQERDLIHVAVIVKDIHLIAPFQPNHASPHSNAISCIIRDWSIDPLLTGAHFCAILLTEGRSDTHPLILRNPNVRAIEVALPQAAEIAPLLKIHAATLKMDTGLTLEGMAETLAGCPLATIQDDLQLASFANRTFTRAELVGMKKRLVEKHADGLVEFIPPTHTLDQWVGPEYVKESILGDIALMRSEETRAMAPMGYGVFGPVGTGKTFLLKCLSGSADCPILSIGNFRDKWVGSSESNLEKVFSLAKSLGRCLVFIDEADQAMGKRDNPNEGGVGGRIYQMFAEEMSNRDNQGKLLWVLATSRPDLLEVDLKRPGRIDVRIPLMPEMGVDDVWKAIRLVANARYSAELPEKVPAKLKDDIPEIMTHGAIDSLLQSVCKAVAKSKTVKKKTQLSFQDALAAKLKSYNPPVPIERIMSQVLLALAEVSDTDMIPQKWREFLKSSNNTAPTKS